MKKRILLVLPLAALATGCGEADPMESVKKTLPEDVEVVEKDEDHKDIIAEYIDDAFVDLVNVSDEIAVYHLSIDLSLSVNGQMGEGMYYSGSSTMKGDLLFGYGTAYIEDKPYTSAFIKLSHFTVNETIHLPQAMKEEMPIPENMSLNDVNLYVYATESEEGTFAYVDLSDETIQNYAKLILGMNGYTGDEDEILDSLLGKKDEETGYRPGLAEVNVSQLIKMFDDANPYHEPLPQQMIDQPLSYFLTMGKAEAEGLKTDMSGIAETVLEFITPDVGVKYSETSDPSEMAAIESVSIAANVRSSQIATALGVTDADLPVHGVAGLLITVGDETGSDGYALQQLSLSANMYGNIEGFNFSFNGSLNLEAAYNELAELIVPLPAELELYSDVTEGIYHLYELLK